MKKVLHICYCLISLLNFQGIAAEPQCYNDADIPKVPNAIIPECNPVATFCKQVPSDVSCGETDDTLGLPCSYQATGCRGNYEEHVKFFCCREAPPTAPPTSSPSASPTPTPSIQPTTSPTRSPTVHQVPSRSPTISPTASPVASFCANNTIGYNPERLSSFATDVPCEPCPKGTRVPVDETKGCRVCSPVRTDGITRTDLICPDGNRPISQVVGGNECTFRANEDGNPVEEFLQFSQLVVEDPFLAEGEYQALSANSRMPVAEYMVRTNSTPCTSDDFTVIWNQNITVTLTLYSERQVTFEISYDGVVPVRITGVSLGEARWLQFAESTPLSRRLERGQSTRYRLKTTPTDVAQAIEELDTTVSSSGISTLSSLIQVTYAYVIPQDHLDSDFTLPINAVVEVNTGNLRMIPEFTEYTMTAGDSRNHTFAVTSLVPNQFTYNLTISYLEANVYHRRGSIADQDWVRLWTTETSTVQACEDTSPHLIDAHITAPLVSGDYQAWVRMVNVDLSTQHTQAAIAVRVTPGDADPDTSMLCSRGESGDQCEGPLRNISLSDALVFIPKDKNHNPTSNLQGYTPTLRLNSSTVVSLNSSTEVSGSADATADESRLVFVFEWKQKLDPGEYEGEIEFVDSTNTYSTFVFPVKQFNLTAVRCGNFAKPNESGRACECEDNYEFRDENGKAECVACPVGTERVNKKSGKCTPCGSLHVRGFNDTTSCTACPSNMAPDESKGKCELCEEDQVISQKTNKCETCPNAKIRVNQRCHCPVETYWNPKDNACHPCPDGAICSFLLPSHLISQQGYFKIAPPINDTATLPSFQKCLKESHCPADADENEIRRLVRNITLPQGYVGLANATIEIEAARFISENVFTTFTNASRNDCTGRRHGALCGECKLGFFPRTCPRENSSATGCEDDCEPCAEDETLTWVGIGFSIFLGLILVVVQVDRTLHNNKHNSNNDSEKESKRKHRNDVMVTVVKLMMSHWHVTRVLRDLRLNWPPPLRVLNNFFSSSSSGGTYETRCIAHYTLSTPRLEDETDYYFENFFVGYAIAASLVPFGFLLFCAGFWYIVDPSKPLARSVRNFAGMCRECYTWCVLHVCGLERRARENTDGEDSPKRAPSWRDMDAPSWNQAVLVSMTVFIAFTYPFLTQIGFEFYSCEQVGSKKFLSIAMSTECGGDVHSRYSFIGGLIILFYVSLAVLFPTSVIYYKILGRWPSFKKVNVKEQQDKLEMKQYSRYRFLFLAFRAEYCYWEIWVILRKLALSFVAAYPTSFAEQLCYAIPIVVVSLVMHVNAKPYIQYKNEPVVTLDEERTQKPHKETLPQSTDKGQSSGDANHETGPLQQWKKYLRLDINELETASLALLMGSIWAGFCIDYLQAQEEDETNLIDAIAAITVALHFMFLFYMTAWGLFLFYLVYLHGYSCHSRKEESDGENPNPADSAAHDGSKRPLRDGSKAGPKGPTHSPQVPENTDAGTDQNVEMLVDSAQHNVQQHPVPDIQIEHEPILSLDNASQRSEATILSTV